MAEKGGLYVYSFYGWLSSNSEEPISELRDNVPGDDYNPIFVGHVNGDIHVRFSGNPNRNRGELQDILDYFLDGTFKFHGIVYVNDSNSSEMAVYKVLKIFNDQVMEVEDSYFTRTEREGLFH